MAVIHRPVLVAEVVTLLGIRPGGVYVDATVGTGGHTKVFLEAVAPEGRVIGIDLDPQALEIARERLCEWSDRFCPVHGNFAELPGILKGEGLERVDGILADLGLSRLQIEMAERGFSFSRAGPIDMRMDSTAPLTAKIFVERVSEGELASILRSYGEERYSQRIAREILQALRAGELLSTEDLANCIRRCYPKGQGPKRKRYTKIDAATRSFQAIRIAVNRELQNLSRLLEHGPDLLSPGGRLAVISYHSLEDRLVKQSFRKWAASGGFRILTKKPIRPALPEMKENPSCRSAKLRGLERLH